MLSHVRIAVWIAAFYRMDESKIQLFKIGDRIRNAHNLNGVVTRYSEGRYDFRYNNGQVDRRMKQSQLRTPVVRCAGTARTQRGSWTNELVLQEAWVDRGGIVPGNVISSRRRSCTSTPL